MAATPVTEQYSAVEETVLAMVSSESLRTSDLMNKAGERGFTPADVREAVWTLLDDGRLELTSDRHLKLR